MKAVIIAAGAGSRLESKHSGFPKTLLSVNNRRVIEVILQGIRKTSIADVVIVTGYKSHVLEEYLTTNPTPGLNIEFCFNPDWELSNGISVLASEKHVNPGEQFILLMSDHIFQSEMLIETVNSDLQQDEALLAIDFKTSQIPDIDDGMKVECTPSANSTHLITKLSKSLDSYQAIDCGMFKLNYSFFNVLQKSISAGNSSLSDACNLLASNNKMLGLDIKDNVWIDLDTPEMFAFNSIINKIVPKQ